MYINVIVKHLFLLVFVLISFTIFAIGMHLRQQIMMLAKTEDGSNNEKLSFMMKNLGLGRWIYLIKEIGLRV